MSARFVGKEDYGQLASFLDESFSQYSVSTSYTPDLLNFFGTWMWNPSAMSIALETETEILAVAFSAQRAATFEQEPLHLVHIGPIAVRADQRGQGHGARLLEMVEESARAREADFLTLTTAANQGPHRLYLRSGFRIVEAYRPLERHFGLNAPLCQGRAREVSLADWESARGPQPARRGAIAEALTSPSWIPDTLCPRYFLGENAGLATLRWKLTQRGRNQVNTVYATQIVRKFGKGAGLEDAVEAACERAAQDGSSCTYALPSVAEVLAQHTREHAPLTYRMAKPLTKRASKALDGAAAWDECCPAP